MTKYRWDGVAQKKFSEARVLDVPGGRYMVTKTASPKFRVYWNNQLTMFSGDTIEEATEAVEKHLERPGVGTTPTGELQVSDAELEQGALATEIQVPYEMQVAFATGRSELMRLVKPRELTVDECRAMYDVIASLIETNFRLRRRASNQRSQMASASAAAQEVSRDLVKLTGELVQMRHAIDGSETN